MASFTHPITRRSAFDFNSYTVVYGIVGIVYEIPILKIEKQHLKMNTLQTAVQKLFFVYELIEHS